MLFARLEPEHRHLLRLELGHLGVEVEFDFPATDYRELLVAAIDRFHSIPPLKVDGIQTREMVSSPLPLDFLMPMRTRPASFAC